jgi:hypothetical protein
MAEGTYSVRLSASVKVVAVAETGASNGGMRVEKDRTCEEGSRRGGDRIARADPLKGRP